MRAQIDPLTMTPTDSDRAPLWRWFLPAAVLVALVLRTWWAWGHALCIEQEGAEYARLAQNLLAGKGYVGIFNAGVQLNFPPLYPLLIAALSVPMGDAEIAARAINILMGAALVVPAFKLAETLHGRRVAVATAVLVVLHPVLVAGSASTYAEGPYLTLMVLALLCLVVWVKERRITASVGCGVCFGLAYLIRPEAFLLAGLFAAGGLAAAMLAEDRRRVLASSLALLAAFIVIAAPNIAFLSYHTGKLRIEAKGTLAYQWGQKINQGLSYTEATSGIGPDLSERGVFMQPNLDVIKSTSYTTSEYAQFVLSAAKKNVAPIIRTVTGEAALGAPWLFALVVLGLFGTAWSRERMRLELLFVIYASVFVLVLLTVQALWFRYFYAILGMLLFWAAKGADELRLWGQSTAGAVIRNERHAGLLGQGLMWFAIAFVLFVAYRNIAYVGQFQESQYADRKEAGKWLATQIPPPRRIMDVGLQVAYYAGADLMYLPSGADSDLAVRYVAKRDPDYIVLVSEARNSRTYFSQWFDQGIPSPNAKLVYDRVNPGGEHVRIYRWSAEPPAATN